MKFWMTASCALVMTACAGCGVIVVNGVGGGGGAGGGMTTTTTGTGMVSTPTAVAFRYGDLPAGVTIDTGSTPAPPDPDSLVLIFTNQPQSCSAPLPDFSIPPTPCDGDDMWVLAMVIPPDLANPGTIDLRNERIGEQASEALPGCNGGGERMTPGGTGALRIAGFGPEGTSTSVQLKGGVTAMTTVIDGFYSATWCSSPPPYPSPTPAIAVLGANLPAGASISPTVGATPDPTATYVFVGTAPQTCTAPVATSGCAGTAQLTFRIPAGMPGGTYDLGDPTLATWYVNGCPGAGQSFPSGSGSITIYSGPLFTPGLSFAIYGSFQSDGVDFDDFYKAPVCAP